jgi:branched-chain amino acid transport system substrate-binding protein
MFFSRRALLKWAALATSSAAISAHAQSAQPITVALIEGLSGAFANTGEAVFRNLFWATERINARGGVKVLQDGKPQARLLVLKRYDSKGQVEEALSAFKAAMDDGVQIVLQGNSSAVAAALIDAINKHNERDATQRVVFLNYSAIDPSLTNEKCSPWHFRFDAHVDMRISALMSVIKDEAAVKSMYMIGQDYSFGQSVLREAKRQLGMVRPDVKLLAEELHPLGRIKDFAPYAAKIKASGADAVLTGNWGNDLTLLIKACREAGFDGRFFTFYANALGAPAAIGEAGVGKVYAVADWLPNAPSAASEAFVKGFRERFPKPQDDYIHMRMALMMDALAQGLDGVFAHGGKLDVSVLAKKLSTARVDMAGQVGQMRGADGQFQQTLMVGVLDKLGAPGVRFDVESSGLGFRVIKVIAAKDAELAHSCKLTLRPS